MPAAAEQALRSAWCALKDQVGPDLGVAVRSSVMAEDLPTASLAGQHDTYTNVQGEAMLADAAIRIEDHYSCIAGEHRPMGIEWAKDGPAGALNIATARPETAASRGSATLLEEFVLEGTGPVKATGRALGARVAAGPVRLVADTPRPTGSR